MREQEAISREARGEEGTEEKNGDQGGGACGDPRMVVAGQRRRMRSRTAGSEHAEAARGRRVMRKEANPSKIPSGYAVGYARGGYSS